MVFVVKFV